MDCSSNNEITGWEIPSIDNLFRIDPQLRMFEKEIRKRFVVRLNFDENLSFATDDFVRFLEKTCKHTFCHVSTSKSCEYHQFPTF